MRPRIQGPSGRHPTLLCLLFAVVLAIGGQSRSTAVADPSGYDFSLVFDKGVVVSRGDGAFFLGGATGGTLSDSGQIVFTSELERGVPASASNAGGRLTSRGIILVTHLQQPRGSSGTTRGFHLVAYAGGPAPNGGFFGPYFQRDPAITSNGDVAFAAALGPIQRPFGRGFGVFRYSPVTRNVTPVMLPGMAAPGGGTFAGADGGARMNDAGEIVFGALVTGADLAPGPPGVDGLGLGVAVFHADRLGRLSRVVGPGVAAPGGGVFDIASNPDINDAGTIAFDAHRLGDPLVAELTDPFPWVVPQQTRRIHAFGGIFLRSRGSTATEVVAAQFGPYAAATERRLGYGFAPRITAAGAVLFYAKPLLPAAPAAVDGSKRPDVLRSVSSITDLLLPGDRPIEPSELARVAVGSNGCLLATHDERGDSYVVSKLRSDGALIQQIATEGTYIIPVCDIPPGEPPSGGFAILPAGFLPPEEFLPTDNDTRQAVAGAASFATVDGRHTPFYCFNPQIIGTSVNAGGQVLILAELARGELSLILGTPR